jgi:KaiC/GvpD/RAD55 family RecA-like ATPase
MRGSAHDKTITEYTIDDRGMHVQGPLTRHTGILGDAPDADDSPPFSE